MSDRTAAALRAELEAIAPDDWAAVARSIAARQAAQELLTALDRPPAPHSRLGWELRRRVRLSLDLEVV